MADDLIQPIDGGNTTNNVQPGDTSVGNQTQSIDAQNSTDNSVNNTTNADPVDTVTLTDDAQNHIDSNNNNPGGAADSTDNGQPIDPSTGGTDADSINTIKSKANLPLGGEPGDTYIGVSQGKVTKAGAIGDDGKLFARTDYNQSQAHTNPDGSVIDANTPHVHWAEVQENIDRGGVKHINGLDDTWAISLPEGSYSTDPADPYFQLPLTDFNKNLISVQGSNEPLITNLPQQSHSADSSAPADPVVPAEQYTQLELPFPDETAAASNAAMATTSVENPSISSRIGSVLKNPAVEKGFGVLAVGGGALQAYDGSQEWQRGDQLDGSADMGGGVANAVGGVAMIAGAGAVAPVAFGLGAGVDGTRDIIQGVQSGDNEKVVIGGIKDTGAVLMAGSVFLDGTIVGAPAGLIVGGVGAGLYLGATVYENRDAIGGAISSAANAAEQGIGHLFGS